MHDLRLNLLETFLLTIGFSLKNSGWTVALMLNKQCQRSPQLMPDRVTISVQGNTGELMLTLSFAVFFFWFTFVSGSGEGSGM